MIEVLLLKGEFFQKMVVKELLSWHAPAALVVLAVAMTQTVSLHDDSEAWAFES